MNQSFIYWDYLRNTALPIIFLIVALAVVGWFLARQKPSMNDLEFFTREFWDLSFWDITHTLVVLEVLLFIGFLAVVAVVPYWKVDVAPIVQILSTDSDQWVEIHETNFYTETRFTEIIPMPNCGNQTTYTYQVTTSQSLKQEIEIDGQIGFPLKMLANNQLRIRYSIQRTDAEDRSLILEAQPNTNVEYPIEWQYVWFEGTITIRVPGADEVSYPYRLNKIQFVVQNPIDRGCP